MMAAYCAQMGWGARALCDTGGDGVGPGLRDLLEMIVRRRVPAGGVYRRSSWVSGGGLLAGGCCRTAGYVAGF